MKRDQAVAWNPPAGRFPGGSGASQRLLQRAPGGIGGPLGGRPGTEGFARVEHRVGMPAGSGEGFGDPLQCVCFVPAAVGANGGMLTEEYRTVEQPKLGQAALE